MSVDTICLSQLSTAKWSGVSKSVLQKLTSAPHSRSIDTSAPCFGGFQPSNGTGRTSRNSRHAQVGSLRLDDLAELRDAHASIALWHLDVEGVEIPVLRSAARLFAARKIERVIFEISLKQWGKFGVYSKKAGLDELKKLFEGWTCTWACNGRLFPWTPVARREVYCAPPWNEYSDLGWGLFDVYCVAPGVDPVWNATHS